MLNHGTTGMRVGSLAACRRPCSQVLYSNVKETSCRGFTYASQNADTVPLYRNWPLKSSPVVPSPKDHWPPLTDLHPAHRFQVGGQAVVSRDASSAWFKANSPWAKRVINDQRECVARELGLDV